MNKALWILVVAVLIAAVGYSMLAHEPQMPPPSAVSAQAAPQPAVRAAERTPEQAIADIVRSANGKLPVMVDKQTRLDRVEAGPGAQLTYRYTLPDMAAPAANGYWISSEVQPKVTRDVCDTPDLRRLLASGAALVYAYDDKHGDDVGRFTVEDADCKRIGF